MCRGRYDSRFAKGAGFRAIAHAASERKHRSGGFCLRAWEICVDVHVHESAEELGR